MCPSFQAKSFQTIILPAFLNEVPKRNVHRNQEKLNLLDCGDIILLNNKFDEGKVRTINI